MRAFLVLAAAFGLLALGVTSASADWGVSGYCDRSPWGACRTTTLPEFERHKNKSRQAEIVAYASGLEAAREVVCRPEFTWPCAWALEVVRCESGYQPFVVGSEYYEPLGRVIYFVGYWQRYIAEATSEAEALAGSLGPYGDTVDAHRQFVEWVQGARTVSPWPVCGPVKPK